MGAVSTTAGATSSAAPAGPADVDVLIVGAGLSGVGAAYRLRERLPGKTVTILESRDAIGGTWDLFRYPGVRSDSDMYTLSYPFRPWTDPKSIADGSSILSYVRETADEAGITEMVRFGQKVVAASWDNDSATWTVAAQTAQGTMRHTCSFLYLATGYYSYDRGHVVDFPGQGDFGGRVVHPQLWPDDLDVTGSRVVVIGSGLAGLTGANCLARCGRKVLLLEHHYQFGGLATWFTRKGGHIFDISLHGFPIGMIKSARKYWSPEIADSIVQLKGIRFVNPQFNLTTTFDRIDFTRLLIEQFHVPAEVVERFFADLRAMNFYDHNPETTGEMLAAEADLSALGMQLPQWGALARELLKAGLAVDDPSDPRSLAGAMAAGKEAAGGGD